MYDLPIIHMTFRKFCFIVFIIFQCIFNSYIHFFFSEMVEIQLIIYFGGHWKGSIYQGGDVEITLVDRNLRYEDLLSTVHEMVNADHNSFVYEIKSLLNVSGNTVKLKIKNVRDIQFTIEKVNGILEFYVTVKPSQKSC